MKRIIFTIMAILVCSAGLTAQTPGVAFADKPVILTSVGQSADIEMVRVLLQRARIEFATEQMIRADDLRAEDRTLIVVLGGSSKGLGAAGISIDGEMRRAEALVRRARELNMSIIAVHVGGEPRRGALSDGLINFMVPLADYVIVVASGDNDGLFTNLTRTANIPLTRVNRIADAGAPLTAAFR